LSDLQAGAVRSSLHSRCLFHDPFKVVSFQDKSLIWEIAMIGKANVKGLSLDVLDASNSASSADTAPCGTSSPRHNSPKQTIRRPELRKIVPLADTTIYEMEQRGEFPRRFHLSSRCVVWDLAEVEAWIEERRRASDAAMIKRAPSPDVRQRKTRPVRH
jgi:prophage regulatory protein